MWKDKGLQLVMLPTTNSSNLGLYIDTKNLVLRKQSDIPRGASQHLYLLSDEKPKYGDMCLDGEYIFGPYENGDVPVDGEFRSITASLDPSLNLPSFPDSFLEEYVKRYNSKKSLEVEVSYNVNSKYYDFYNGEQVNQYISTYKVKVDLSNTISIRFKEEKKPCTSEVVAEAMRLTSKDVRTPKVTYPFDIKHNGERMYSQAQMEMRLFEGIAHAISYPETFVTGICLDSTKTKNWIKENLK